MLIRPSFFPQVGILKAHHAMFQHGEESFKVIPEEKEIFIIDLIKQRQKVRCFAKRTLLPIGLIT